MNLVEAYLTTNPTLKLSIKSISKRTGLKRKVVTYFVFNSSLLRKVDPLEVGSLKSKINVFTSNID